MQLEQVDRARLEMMAGRPVLRLFTGVVQRSTSHERFWSWLGSVTHWIYFTSFREHTFVWAQTIIWLTVVAMVLTVLGIYIGLKRLKRRRNGRLSPYRGWMLWHHYAGLVFGLFVFTWLLSGLFSMGPWGLFEGRSFDEEQARLRERPLSVQDVRGLIGALSGADLPPGTVRIDSSLVHGELALLAWDSRRGRTRLDARSLQAKPLPESAFSRAAKRMRPQTGVRSEGWLLEDDAYYYSHHTRVDLPVYRVSYADGERFYLDRITGELVLAVDAERQQLRWWFYALHRGDFSRLARTRPVWDLFMLPLLTGVTLGALTGTWLGLRRLFR